jgi:hypothetical protein
MEGMPVPALGEIESIARRLLDHQLNVVVRHRLLRDVLRQPPASTDLQTARTQLLAHPWVEELVRDQHIDGSWGRFHSMDSSVKNRFPTSEFAVRRALALGLDKDAPPLTQAIAFMERVLKGDSVWSDRVEKSEGWPIGVQTITAATLAQIYPIHPAVLPAWEYWLRIASGSFPGGSYDPCAEWQSHRKARGLGIIYLASRYTLTLLAAQSTALPAELEGRIVDWIWNNSAGIGYLGVDLRQPTTKRIQIWLESNEILSGFHSWRKVALEAIQWLWNQRNSDGLWDFVSKVSPCPYFPLSDDWRKTGNRSLDHSTRILVLLRKFLQD